MARATQVYEVLPTMTPTSFSGGRLAGRAVETFASTKRTCLEMGTRIDRGDRRERREVWRVVIGDWSKFLGFPRMKRTKRATAFNVPEFRALWGCTKSIVLGLRKGLLGRWSYGTQHHCESSHVVPDAWPSPPFPVLGSIGTEGYVDCCWLSLGFTQRGERTPLLGMRSPTPTGPPL